MTVSLSELAQIANAEFEGDGQCLIHSINTLADALPNQIAFISHPSYKDDLLVTRACAVILKAEWVVDCPVKNKIICEDPYLAYARIAQFFYQQSQRVTAQIHSSVIIDKTAKIDDTANIQARVVIGRHAVIGQHCQIGAGSIIGDHCLIGDGSVLSAHVTLYSHVSIGNNCLIHSGAVIGADGFGFAHDKGEWVKIPQTGGVKIGHDVEIGANTTIDRGALRDTCIGDGVKLDNQIQIAHNVSIGKHTAIAGNTAIAGSTEIGEHCTIGGCSGIVGHISIASDIHVSAMTIVTKSLSKSGQYTGNVPALPHKDWAKNTVRIKKLDDMAKKLKALENELHSLK